MKKKIVIVLAVVLTLTLLLTSVALADIGHKHVICYPWGGVKVSNWLDMSYYCETGSCCCGPSSGVSIGRYYREALDLDGDQGVVTITEDFEWGSVGTSLGVEPPLGDVDWTVSASGGSYAQIDDGAAAQLGLKGAKFYRDGTNSILASYPCNPADYLGFYVKKDANSFFYFDHGNGSTRIIVRITSGELIQYYDTAYRTIGDPILVDRWYLLEFRNIDWIEYTYDIYLDGDLLKSGAPMQSSSYANGIARFSNTYAGNTGSFWIDHTFAYVPVVEDFEWGNLGDNLATSGGEVPWTVSTPSVGNSVVEIDTAEKHRGTRSAKFYFDGVYPGIQASYPQASPTWRKFYFKGEDADSSFCTITGDETHILYVRVRPNDSLSSYVVEYFDGWSWKEVYTISTPGTWHCLEFKNISWVNHTYDILIDEECYKIGADMYEYYGWYSMFNGITAYRYYDFSCCGGGSGARAFWIDDILDTRVGYPSLPDDDAMYDALYYRMGTWPSCYTPASNYGPGFVAMTTDYGYDNFSCDQYDIVTADDYWDIVNAIDNGWPVALASMRMTQGFTGVEAIWTDGNDNWPATVWHWITIKGYTYHQSLWPPQQTYDLRIICTDSYSHASNLMLGWDNLIDVVGENNLRAFIIRDGTYRPELTTVQLLPEEDSNPVDTPHELTVTVRDQFYNGMEGVILTWSISGVGSFSGIPEGVTDASGQAYAEITSSFPGTSTVRCEVAGNPSVYATATNEWTYTPEATTLELMPETGENPVDTTHDLTATVYDQFNYVMEGVAVTWSIDGVGSFYGTPESPTDTNGEADGVITSSVPGISTVMCEVTGNPSICDTATKEWTYTPAATTLELFPEAGENPVDTTHNLTATVYDQFDYVMEDVAVAWTIESGPGSFVSQDTTTDVNGEADAEITSGVLGTSTVRCEVTGNPLVYDTATKDWTYLEDFEWGNDGDSLGMDGGNIDWTVETDGSSVAEIDTAQANSGIKSGRFYYDGSSENILAYYSQDSPTWRGFYLMKDKNAVPHTITGDGTNTVLVRVAKNEFVQYYDGSWNNVCKISDSNWHFIEFRNIDWVGATYDIYVDNELENSDTPMSASTSYNGLTAYYGGEEEGEFWIDDILK